MGTRSRIGNENSDGSVTAIYCHWDGYVEYNGKVLSEHYRTPAKIASLLDLGSLSSLKPRVSKNNDWQNPKDDCCLAHIHRGEEKSVQEYDSRDEYAKQAFEWGEEYAYLFDGREWLYITYSDKVWRPVNDALATAEA